MSGQRDGFALGVDLGTSNTVAVLRWPDGRTRPLLVDGEPILPSGVYADTDGRLHVGRDALRLAHADPDRYEPNPKRRVDEPEVTLGDRRYRPAELLGGVLRAVGEAAVAALGFLPPAVVTCPATWDADRRQVLAEALALAGWPSAAEHTLSGPTPPGTRLLREPVAAARYYTEVLRRPVPVGESVAVFDFGGGTLDVAVVRNEGADPWGDSGFRVISCGGLDDLGGLDLDAALLALVGARITATHPAQWARLSQPADTTGWRERLQFVEHVRGAKEMLSRTTAAPVAVPGVPAAVSLTRAELEGVAAPLLRRAVAETRRVIADAGLTPDRLAGLFLVGGSSRIPLVARLLHADLGIAPTVLEQPELPVAEGALTDLPLRRNASAAPPLPLAPVGAAPAGPNGTRVAPAPQGTPLAAGPHGTAVAPHSPAPGTPLAAGPHGTAVAPHSPVSGTPASAPVPPGSPVGGVPPQGPGIPHQPGAWPGWTGVPQSGSPTDGGRRRRALWISVGAVVALAGVATATVLYLTRDRHPELDFEAFGKPVRVAAGGERPVEMFTAVAGDRAYLAYPREDDRLAVVAVEAGTGKELWRKESATTADRWAGVLALPGAVALLADASGSSTPRQLEVLDGGHGTPRWRHTVQGDDEIFVGRDVVAVTDHERKRLVGLKLSNGDEKWSLADLTDQYGSTRDSVHPVTTDDAVSGPGYGDGSPRDPEQGPVEQLVQVSADRSVRLIDLASGDVVRDWKQVAEPDDLVVAHEDRLFVAGDDGRLLAYDLGKQAQPSVLYRAENTDRRAKALAPCGEHRACLLEVTDSDDKTAVVVAAQEDKGVKRWPAPGMTQLVPVGERVLARRLYPEPAATLFAPDGRKVLDDEDGVAVRVDAGNLLVFADPLGSGVDDRSAAGVGAGSGRVAQLGELKDVRGDSCSWNTRIVVCGSEEDFVLYRFVTE
ncbi:Hsp70 family protein [Micromonospora chersina]|uniref:Hsp70 family protein n=1 Tax=Micromonospora chersina TaxID=47854 RepID=UPI0033CE6826